MGKASRMKKVHRNAMADRPKWQAEASRQARERRDEAVNQHNASFEATMEKFNALSGDASVILIKDGVRYEGKEQMQEVFASWVRNELRRDDPSRLGAIAALGSLMKLSIWDVKVEIIDFATGAISFENPLIATFFLDNVKCFAWLLDHAVANLETSGEIISEILAIVLPRHNVFDLGSDRWASSRLLLQTVFENMSYEKLEDFVVQMNQAGRGTDPVGCLANECFGRVQAEADRKELESLVPMRDDAMLVVPNPHAIGPGTDAENDSVYDDESHTQAVSKAKRL